MSKYCVIPTTELTDAHIESCDQDSLHTVRKSLDGTKAIVSYQGSKPNVLRAYKELDQDKAVKLMQSWRWNPNAKKPWYAF